MMRRAPWLVPLARSILIAVALGCADSVSGPDALQLSVAVGTRALAVGDSTLVTIRLRNNGIRPITITTGGCFILPYIARAATGEVVYPRGGAWGCLAVVRNVTLGPGQSETQQYKLRGGETAPSPSLGPEEYVLYATLESSEYPLRSAPVQLRVLAP